MAFVSTWERASAHGAMVAVGTGHDAAVEGDLLALLGLCVCVCGVCVRKRERCQMGIGSFRID